MNNPKTALISVADKTSVVALAQNLTARGIKIMSTGGTAKALKEAGVPLQEVAEYIGFPEVLGGRVKTLHPKVHAGILARRDEPSHQGDLAQHNITTIDIVVVNLYPFSRTVANPECMLPEAIEQIDIGGVTLLRAAAKNYNDVLVLCDPSDYAHIDAYLDADHKSDRLTLSAKAFTHTAQYDIAISQYLTKQQATPLYPEVLLKDFRKVSDLRYGENPHQSAAFYRDMAVQDDALTNAEQLNGKELSFNNRADAASAWDCVRSFNGLNKPACVIVKHANPCGVGLDESVLGAYQKAWHSDAVSAFGGIIAFNQEVDKATAEAISEQFFEVIVAPRFTTEALALLQQKKNLRLLATQNCITSTAAMRYQSAGGALLVQSHDEVNEGVEDFKVVSKRQVTQKELADALFAWKVAAYVKSNAIVVAADGQTLGIGAGQMSRVDAARISVEKAQNKSLQGAVAASDAFFPFRDSVDVLAKAGVACFIEPGGSMRDEEVIAAVNEHNAVLIFTGQRHFRH